MAGAKDLPDGVPIPRADSMIPRSVLLMTGLGPPLWATTRLRGRLIIENGNKKGRAERLVKHRNREKAVF